MLLVPQTAAVASNVILLCFGLFFLSCFLFLRKQSCLFYSAVGGEPVLGGALFFFFFFFFVLYFCLSHLLRGGMKAIPLYHRCRQSTKAVAFPPPPSSGTFSRDVFVFSCSVFSVSSGSRYFSFSFSYDVVLVGVGSQCWRYGLIYHPKTERR